MKLLPSYKTVSVPQQKTWQQVNLAWFDINQLENSSQLKSVDLVVMTLHNQYLYEKQLFLWFFFH